MTVWKKALEIVSKQNQQINQEPDRIVKIHVLVAKSEIEESDLVHKASLTIEFGTQFFFLGDTVRSEIRT